MDSFLPHLWTGSLASLELKGAHLWRLLGKRGIMDSICRARVGRCYVEFQRTVLELQSPIWSRKNSSPILDCITWFLYYLNSDTGAWLIQVGGWVRLKMKFSNGRTHRIAEHLCPFLLFSNLCILSCVQLFPTLGTVAHQGPLSMGFSRQEHWSGLPFPSPRDLPDLGIKLMFLVSSALQEAFFFFFF